MPEELVPYTPPESSPSRGWLELLEPAARLADTIARTDFVPSALRGNTAAITAAILYGDEVGLPPMQSLAKVHVIEGRPALAAEAQRALILAAGHEVWLESSTATSVVWCGRRRGSDQVTRMEWTMDDARRAGLDRRQNWTKYPRAMLSARASADLARALFPDVIGGLMALEELEDPAGITVDGPEITGDDPGTGKKPRKAKRSFKAKTPAASSSAEPVTPTPTTLPPLPGQDTGPKPPQAAASATPAEPATPALPGPPEATEAAHDEGPSLPWPNYYAMKCTELGLNDDQRHGLTLLATAGDTERAAEMDDGARDFAREAIDKIARKVWRLSFEAGIDPSTGRAVTAWRLERKVNGVVEAVRVYIPTTEPTEAPPSDDDDVAEAEIVTDEPEATHADTVDDVTIRRLMRAKGVRVAAMLRKAGEGLGASAPASVAEVLERPDLAASIVAWLEGLAVEE